MPGHQGDGAGAATALTREGAGEVGRGASGRAGTQDRAQRKCICALGFKELALFAGARRTLRALAGARIQHLQLLLELRHTRAVREQTNRDGARPVLDGDARAQHRVGEEGVAVGEGKARGKRLGAGPPEPLELAEAAQGLDGGAALRRDSGLRRGGVREGRVASA